MTTHTFTVDLPNGAVVDASVVVVSYLHGDGQHGYAVEPSHGPSSTLLGILTFAEHEIVADNMRVSRDRQKGSDGE